MAWVKKGRAVVLRTKQQRELLDKDLQTFDDEDKIIQHPRMIWYHRHSYQKDGRRTERSAQGAVGERGPWLVSVGTLFIDYYYGSIFLACAATRDNPSSFKVPQIRVRPVTI